MTKVIILGQEPQEEKKLKPIEATHCLQKESLIMYKSEYYLKHYNELRVIKTNKYLPDFDCIIISEDGYVFLGHFNDGIVE